MTTNNKISNLISSQSPFYVRNDHTKFVRFLELYYEYLEQSGKAVSEIKNVQSYSDIDQTIDPYAQQFYDQFLKLIPTNVSDRNYTRAVGVDKPLIIKHIKDFYRARGTEKSIRFLLRVLFDQEASFYYPKVDVLKTSDGKWLIEKSIRVRDVKINGVATTDVDDILKFTSKNILGNTSNARAIVETVDVYYLKGSPVYELKVSNQIRNFESSESIFTTFSEEGTTKTLTANLYSGIVSSVALLSGGSGYVPGNTVPVESSTGSNASVIIADVTRGNIKSIFVTAGGAGFQNSNPILISGGSGSGAAANVVVNADGSVHPNSYSIVYSTISLVSNVTIGNTSYPNLNMSNANTTIVNAVNSYIFANCGPIFRAVVTAPGTNYLTIPTLDVQSNTNIRSLGILGRMEIVDGGSNYAIGDTISITNVIGGYGSGAAANVSNVDSNGAITKVSFVPIPGHIVGGSGYLHDKLPTATVTSGTGNGASIAVTAILGDNENLGATVDSIGRIISLTLISGGSDYETPPVINLTSQGDGTAQAVSTIITGTFTYPGRYINDDGHLSGFNFLENRDYYQNYSYVVRINASLKSYKKAILDLIHPGGMRLFGEFLLEDKNIPSIIDTANTDTGKIFKFKTANFYSAGYANGSNIVFNIAGHSAQANDNIYVEYLTTSSRNIGFVNIANAGIDYSNGYINFQSASGAGANAYVTVNSIGSIVSVTLNNRGLNYNSTDSVFANVSNLLTYNIATMAIANTGSGYSNGFVSISGGSGRNANANVSVNATGAITTVTINNRGTGYLSGDAANIALNIDSLVSYNVSNGTVVDGGRGFSNGYINIIGGSGYGANANVSVDANGTIKSLYVLNNGNGYKLTDLNVIEANVAHLASYNIGNVLLIAAGTNFSNGYISFEGGSGSGANANISVDRSGVITTVTINNRGTGYANGDAVIANVASLVKYNVANINITNTGIDYSNGYITFTGGTGRDANAIISVYGNGAIKTVNLVSGGSGYSLGDVVVANVANLLTFNIASANIIVAGNNYSNGYVTISGGTGRDANASVTANYTTGAIESVTINAPGTGYSNGDLVIAVVNDLLTTNIQSLGIVAAGSGYSNGYINFETSGIGHGANANVSVNATGSIVSTTLLLGGTGYRAIDTIYANTQHLGGSNGNVSITLSSYKNDANIRFVLQKGGNAANLPVTISRSAANSAILNVNLQIIGSKANLELNLQKGFGGANLTPTVQLGANGANLSVALQNEPITAVTDGIYRVITANTDWIFIEQSNTTNTFGTASVGISV